MSSNNVHSNNNFMPDNENNYNFNSKIMLTAIFSLSFVIILVIILHLYARYVLRHPRRSLAFRSASLIYSHAVQHVEPAPAKSGLDPMVIDSLPSFVFKQLESHDQEECAVCLSMMVNNELVRSLPNCNHVFHMECIDKWLTGQPTCPICRSEVTPRLTQLDREPPRGSERVEVVIPTSNGGQDDFQGILSSSNSNNVTGKVQNVSGSSSSSSSHSFRLSSFRKMIGRDRSSSSRRIQVQAEPDIERQGQ